jgi:anti-sigma factor RsiW
MTMGSHPSANLIRLYCDGELSPEQTSDFEQRLEANPGLKAVVVEQLEIERRMRGCVGSAIKSHCPCAPKDLDQRIKVLFSQVTDLGEPEPEVVGRIGANGREYSRARLPNRANVFAVAATLALIAGAVLFGIFGRTIDETAAPPVDLVARAAISASEHHDSIASDEKAQKECATVAEVASERLTQWMGVPVEVFDLKEVGYEFVGAEHCEITLPDRTAHLVYKSTTADARKPMVSIFIVPYSGKCGGLCQNMEVATWVCAAKGKCRHNVLYSTDKKLVYFLVCCNESDLGMLTRKLSQKQALKQR